MRKSRALLLAAAAAAFTGVVFVSPQVVRATAAADVSAGELAGYQQLYNLQIPDSYNFNNTGVPYSVDNSGSIANGSFGRVAYYMELQSSAANSPRYWVWASMNTFNAAANRLGVPNAGTNIVENGTQVSAMNVQSNHPLITNATNQNGIIEFWASDYGPNGGGAFGSNNNFFDWKDSGGSTGGGHGSMQIFNITTPGSEQTLFGFNGLNQSGHMGIGNQVPPNTGDTDWTFGPSANNFTVKNLEVWVSVPEPASAVVLGFGALALAAHRRRRSA